MIVKKLFFFLFLICWHSSLLLASNDLFEKDFKLTHTLLREEITDKGNLFRYHIHLENRNNLTEKNYQLCRISRCGKPDAEVNLWVDKEKKVWIQNGEKKIPLEKFEFILSDDFLDGESADFLLVDFATILAATRIFPCPIEIKTEDGIVLAMELESHVGNYLLTGSGFKPNEVLLFTSQSENEIIPSCQLPADENGRVQAGIMPQVIGKSHGSASVLITRQDGTEFFLPYHWGNPSQKT